jgi:hypothetical protein
MGALPTPVEPANPPQGPPPARRFLGAKQKWYLELLETCRALAGLPVLVSLILEAITPDTRIIGIGAVVAVIIALVLRFFPRLRLMLKPRSGHALWAAVPWFTTALLAILLVFKIIPDRATKQKDLLANSWLTWQKNLASASSECAKAKEKDDKANDHAQKVEAERALALCMANALDPVLYKEPRPASDLVAGDLMLADDNARAVLGERLSVGDKFLGSGFSLPWGQNDPAVARVPEYFVPNLRDDSDHVWVWKLEHSKVQDQKPIMDRKLLEVLQTFDPANNAANHADFKSSWSWLKQHLQPNDSLPVLVRFALMDPQKVKYSGCLGRPDATRVFMSNLRELASRTVRQAAQSTGYNKPEKSDERGMTLFIWVYAPTEEDQVVKATWSSVLTNFSKWVKSGDCEAAN